MPQNCVLWEGREEEIEEGEYGNMKRAKIMRFIGIVCWFLALFILLDGHQEKKAAKEAEEAAQQAAIVNQIEESGEGSDSTVLFPTK